MPFGDLVSRGAVSSGTAGSTLARSPTSALLVGELVVVVVQGDNIANEANEHVSVGDTQGNTWTQIFEESGRAESSASASGTTVSAWYSVLETEIGTGDTITGTWSQARTERNMGILSATIDAAAVELDAVISVGGTANSPSIASGTVADVEHLLIGIAAIEAPDTDGFTQDADYDTVMSPYSGNQQIVHISFRILTGTSDSYDPFYQAARDNLTALISFSEVASGGPVFSEPVHATEGASAALDASVQAFGAAHATEGESAALDATVAAYGDLHAVEGESVTIVPSAGPVFSEPVMAVEGGSAAITARTVVFSVLIARDGEAAAFGTATVRVHGQIGAREGEAVAVEVRVTVAATVAAVEGDTVAIFQLAPPVPARYTIAGAPGNRTVTGGPRTAVIAGATGSRTIAGWPT